MSKLKQLDLIGVITGFEGGAVLTDQINKALGLSYANPIENSLARFDKFETNQAINQQGIPSIFEIKLNTSELDDKAVFRDKISKNIRFPAVIKPTQSGASFGVYFCDDIEKTIQAMVKISEENDSFFGTSHCECVLQEQLTGKEFFIDLLSFAGEHHVASINYYNKIVLDGRPLYQSVNPVDFNDPAAQKVIHYVKEVLDAVAFNYGPSHIEVFLTEDGPRLVEINPRVNGASGFNNKMCKLTLGHDQLDLMADLYTHNKPQDNTDQDKLSHGKVVFLCNFHDPATLNPEGLEEIKSTLSFKEIKLFDRTLYPRTTDMHTLVGFVLLTHQDEKQLDQDYQRIIDLQKNGLF